jgi:hypothetical protein
MQVLAAVKPQPVAVVTDYSDDAIGEYLTVANQVGLQSAELTIARFKSFMAKNDLPTYDLKTVAAYMDGIAKRDNKTGLGWHWAPLREQDKHRDVPAFGTPSRDPSKEWGSFLFSSRSIFQELYGVRQGGKTEAAKAKKEEPKKPEPIVPASDYWNGGVVYGKPVPLHALKRVAMIERELGKKKIAFAVSDYATEPHIKPDPFLLAIIPNSNVGEGVGRFVIDVWDEPGFEPSHPERRSPPEGWRRSKVCLGVHLPPWRDRGDAEDGAGGRGRTDEGSGGSVMDRDENTSELFDTADEQYENRATRPRA